MSSGPVNPNVFIEIDGVPRYGKVGERWLKDLEAEELRELVLTLARLLESEERAHRETMELAAARGCAG
jgi:hypothetical protein